MKPDAQTYPTFKTAYSPTETVVIIFPESEGPTGKTKQEFADDSNINNIMARFEKTGLLDYVREHEPQYGDVTGIDFQESMNKVIEAQHLFDDLPATWRKKFNNNPVEFLEFVQDPSNLDEAIRLGIATKKVVVDPTPKPATTGDPLKAVETALTK